MNAKRVNKPPVEHKMTDDEYCDMLDEFHPEVIIGCCSFKASRILQELDPIAFNCGKLDFESDSQYDCGECGIVHGDESDANDCCELWECDNCGLTYDDESDADDCCSDDDELDDDDTE